MLGALRRCSTSLARSQSLGANTSRIVQRLNTARASIFLHTQFQQRNDHWRCYHQSRHLGASAAAQVAETSQQDASHPGVITQFQDLASEGLVSSVVIDTITKDMKFEVMTDVQSATINEALRGTDMYALQ